MNGHRQEDPASCFVGVLVPDEPRFHGPAFSRAGIMFQEGLLGGLRAAGLPVDTIYSIEPTAAFPRSRRVLSRGGTCTTSTGLRVRLLPFVNIHPLKWLTSGVAVWVWLLAWSWRTRGRTRIVHCLNLTMPPGLFVWMAARMTGSKLVGWILDVFEPGVLVADNWRHRLDFVLQKWLMRRLDGMVVVSQRIADDFAPARRVCRIEGGVSPAVFARTEGDRARADRRPFRIVLAGTLESYNGVGLALDALAELPEGFELVVAGAGSYAERVRSQAAGDPRLVFAGYVDFRQLLSLYRSADLLLNLRLTRAVDTRYFFPSKLMELLASGTAVLSTCTGHVAEVYGHVLYLLEEETPQALVRRLGEIAAQPSEERVALGARAKAFMLAEKTWDRQGERLAEYLRREVLGS